MREGEVVDNTIVIEGIKGKYNLEDLKDNYWGQKILEKAKEEGLEIVCICLGVSNALPLHVRILPHSGNKHSYTLVRNPNTMEYHHENCPNFGVRIEEDEEVKKAKLEKEKKERFDDDSEETKVIQERIINNRRLMHFNTNAHVFTRLAVNNNLLPDEEYDRNSSRYRKSTMFSIGENLLFDGWETYIENKKRFNIPTIKNVFYNIYFNEELPYTIGRDISINISDVIFKPFIRAENIDITDTAIKAFYKIHIESGYNHFMYVLGRVDSVEKYNDKFSKLTIIEPFKDNYINVLVNTNTFKNHWKERPSKADKYISCFVKVEDNMLYVTKLAIIPVLKDRGVSVDSNYEVEFAEKLIEEKILFIKPPKSFNPYKHLFNKYNPDFLLLEKSSRKIATIVEVFGYERDNEYWEDYWEKANRKINFYKSLDDYNFLYWNAYEGRPIPTIYQPTIRKNKDKEQE